MTNEKAPLMVNSGTLIDRVLLDAATTDMQDDMSLWDAAGNFLDWAVTVAYLIPGEFPEGLYNLNKVSYYAAQVDNGGHQQFAQNSGWKPDVIERVTVGLKQMNAMEFSALYAEFRDLMDSGPEIRNKTLEVNFIPPPGAIYDLDLRFDKLGGVMRLVQHGAAWLRSLPNLALLSPEELAKEKAAVIARNTAFDVRHAARIAACEAAEAADPKYVAAKRLCALNGLTFSRLTAGSFTDQSDTMRWGVMTTNGVFYMVIGPKQAQFQEKTGKVLATIPVET